MSLQRMLTDNAFIENKNGERVGPFKTKFGGAKLVVFNDQLVVSEDDIVIQLQVGSYFPIHITPH